MARSENGRERRKREERVAKLKRKNSSGNKKSYGRERHFKKRTPRIAQGARIRSIHHAKKICYEEGSNYCHFTFTCGIVRRGCNHSNLKNGQDTFGVVSIGHIKTYDSFCAVKEGKYSRHFNAIFEARVLQRLAGCDYFPQFFSVFDGKLVMELIACKDNKVITVFKHAEGK